MTAKGPSDLWEWSGQGEASQQVGQAPKSPSPGQAPDNSPQVKGRFCEPAREAHHNGRALPSLCCGNPPSKRPQKDVGNGQGKREAPASPHAPPLAPTAFVERDRARSVFLGLHDVWGALVGARGGGWLGWGLAL